MQITLSLIALLSTPILAIDYISTYNLDNVRWGATLDDEANNVTCTITYDNVASLLTADSNGYLSGPTPIAIPCDNVNYLATTKVGVTNATISYTVPGAAAFVFDSTTSSQLEDGEIIQTAYGVTMD